VISIGGAVPSAAHFDLAAVRLNLPGLVVVGFTTDVSAFVADRFGNFNILQGTQVSFFTEAGAIDTSQATDATGIATAVIRTQNPAPVTVAAPSPQPLPQANGWVTVIAVVRGEESFVDSNANGIYDLGEPFTDLDEPYIDANDNGVYDLGEQFVDTNQNGVHDGPNGFWDGPGCPQAGCSSSPNIWRSLRLAFTGNIVNCSIAPATINVPNAGSETFIFSVSDANDNAPGPGTTVSFSATGGSLQGGTSFTVPNIVGGPYTGSVTLVDSAPTSGPTAGSITMTVTSPDVVTCVPVTINGTVN
jgi:adhesin/invasin